jgi:HlyD family secretion protein
LNVDELTSKRCSRAEGDADCGRGKGTEYTGVVTKVNIKGTTQNGVPSYPVTIRIDNTEGLLPV